MSAIPTEKFHDILRLIWSHLTAASVHLSTWEELRSTPEREKLCDTYPGFFSWTRDAHVDRFINKLCVVIDTDSSQPSIPKLANMIQSNPDLAPGVDSNRIFERLDAQAKIISEIRMVRDTRSAHWDLKKTPPEPNVADCHALLDELKAILEDLWNAHSPNASGGTDFYSLVPVEHAHPSYVLDKLTETMTPHALANYSADKR